MKRATREWVRKAEGDHRAALRLAHAKDPLHDQVSFFCQQVCEKYFKAVVEELAQTIPKTHDLEKLLYLLLQRYPALRSFRRPMRSLSKFAVSTRYPGANTSKRQAAAALRWAESVREECRSLLALPKRTSRRKKPP